MSILFKNLKQQKEFKKNVKKLREIEKKIDKLFAKTFTEKNWLEWDGEVKDKEAEKEYEKYLKEAKKLWNKTFGSCVEI